MCNWVLKNNQEKPFRLFVYIKLYYPEGKIKLERDDYLLASLTLGDTERTIRNNIKKLIDFGWVKWDKDYNDWTVNSIDKIRANNHWLSRRSYRFEYKDLFHIYGTLGGILYTQLYKSYCRKYFKGKSKVLLKASADESLTFSYINKYAEISVLSVNRIFNISINKSVRLKQKAEKLGFLKIKKNCNKLTTEQAHIKKMCNKYNDLPPNIFFKKGIYYEQLTDLIYSEMIFHLRKKIETL